MEMQVLKILADAMRAGASDILIVSGGPLCYKINGRVEHAAEERLSPDDTENLIRQIYALDHQRDLSTLLGMRETTIFPFRSAAWAGSGAAPTSSAAPFPPCCGRSPFPCPMPRSCTSLRRCCNSCDRQKGLVLVTGPAGSGKSTTLACYDQPHKSHPQRPRHHAGGSHRISAHPSPLHRQPAGDFPRHRRLTTPLCGPRFARPRT